MKRLAADLLLGLLLACAIVVAACSYDRAPAAVKPAPAASSAPSKPEADARGTTDQKQAEVDRLTSELAAATTARDLALAGEKRAEDRAKLDGLRRLARWIAGIAFIGIFASVALAVLLPAGRQWAIGGGLACAALVAVALGSESLLPYLPAIGVVVIGSGVVWGVCQFGKLLIAGKAMAAHGDLLERSVLALVEPDTAKALVASVKKVSAEAQDCAGVRGLIAGVRGKPKPPKPALVAAAGR